MTYETPKMIELGRAEKVTFGGIGFRAADYIAYWF